ncbi:helix-turn-helix domain-containing protein [Lactococcus lactis]|uniref:helix-turn-helix domain-containing protein n=1 Tax=Lactococcus lactis TaxID=1358 RepID=UPI00189AC5EF|nr:helix-turn-helix transcriptional regulator [Lactococcus lactis]
MTVFAERLTELREKRGLSKQALADLLEINRVTYSNWELGKARPNFETLSMLSDFYNVNIDYLLSRKNQKVFENEKIYTEEDLIIILQDFEKFILPFSLNLVHSCVPKYLNYRKNQRN